MQQGIQSLFGAMGSNTSYWWNLSVVPVAGHLIIPAVEMSLSVCVFVYVVCAHRTQHLGVDKMTAVLRTCDEPGVSSLIMHAVYRV